MVTTLGVVVAEDVTTGATIFSVFSKETYSPSYSKFY